MTHTQITAARTRRRRSRWPFGPHSWRRSGVVATTLGVVVSTLTMAATVMPADGPYFYLPFDVPPGTSRIDVTLAYPWWQRVFGTGTIFMETLDPAHPVRRLPGIRNAEQLRRQLDEAAHARRDPKQAASGPSGRPDAQHRADPEPA